MTVNIIQQGMTYLIGNKHYKNGQIGKTQGTDLKVLAIA